jgi:hypothetical protein
MVKTRHGIYIITIRNAKAKLKEPQTVVLPEIHEDLYRTSETTEQNRRPGRYFCEE